MKYKLGNLKLKNRVFLAPMLEPNDIAFRILCKRAGCGLTWSGMTSALSRKKLDLDDKPILQLFGNSVRGIGSFMRRYDSGVSGWDFNLGCPSKLSRRLGHGACLEDLGVVRDILRVMRGKTDKVLTVKIRKSSRAFDILRIAEEEGVDAIVVHGRTLGQGYTGEVDYDWALEVKRKSGIPVIFSGVSRLEDVEGILRDFDFVMIGRLAIGRPEIFGEVDGDGRLARGRKNGSRIDVCRCGFGEYLKLAEKYGLFFRQVKYQAINFTKGMRGGARLRESLVEARNVGEVEEILAGKVL